MRTLLIFLSVLFSMNSQANSPDDLYHSCEGKRLGIFYMDFDAAGDGEIWKAFHALKFAPLSVKADHKSKVIQYIGTSFRFNTIGDNCDIPVYGLAFDLSADRFNVVLSTE